MHVAFPFTIDRRGTTATTDDAGHVRDLIEQVLFTAQGERVNRPDFGSGVERLVFAPGSDELVTATTTLIRGALQRWLADVIVVGNVETTMTDGTLEIVVAYTDRASGQPATATFARQA